MLKNRLKHSETIFEIDFTFLFSFLQYHLIRIKNKRNNKINNFGIAIEIGELKETFSIHFLEGITTSRKSYYKLPTKLKK